MPGMKLLPFPFLSKPARKPVISSRPLLLRARRAGKPSWCHWGILQREEVAGLPSELAAVGADACCLAPASPWERGTALGGGICRG